MEIKLKYGCNPHQSNARVVVEGTPLKVLNGQPGYINLLDAFAAWQLARELAEATGRPGAASFKHVSPAGAAVAQPLSDDFLRSQLLEPGEYSPVATAYARARGGDRMCSYGDMAAVSHKVDATLAKLLKQEVSDGIIAPDYDGEALDILKTKKGGKYLVLQMDPGYVPEPLEYRSAFGFRMEQDRNMKKVDRSLLNNIVTKNREIPDAAADSLIVATIALKYTQSNSVCVAYDGQVIGMGAGQQSRVHCTRLACGKADKWFLQQHPRVLSLQFKDGLKRPDKTNIIDAFLLWEDLSDFERKHLIASLKAEPKPLSPEERTEWMARFPGIVLSSDAFFPFRDNIDRASKSGVRYVLQAGGSLRDEDVTAAADEYGMVMAHSGVRWFLH